MMGSGAVTVINVRRRKPRSRKGSTSTESQPVLSRGLSASKGQGQQWGRTDRCSHCGSRVPGLPRIEVERRPSGAAAVFEVIGPSVSYVRREREVPSLEDAVQWSDLVADGPPTLECSSQ